MAIITGGVPNDTDSEKFDIHMDMVQSISKQGYVGESSNLL